MTNDSTEKRPSSNGAKRLARLVAVQSLYRASYEEEPLDDVLRGMIEEAGSYLNSEGDEGGDISDRPDTELLLSIAHGVAANREALMEMLKGSLDARFSADRIETLLRQIFLAGAYELLNHADIAPQIIISDYVDVTRAFYSAKEPGLVNAVLDRLSKSLRRP